MYIMGGVSVFQPELAAIEENKFPIEMEGSKIM